MDLIERFRYIIKINQMTPSNFADEIGVQRSSVSHVLSGRNKPSMEFIQKVLQRFPKVDAAWLINGSKNSQMPMEKDLELEFEQIGQMVNSEELEQKEKTEKNKKIARILVFYDDNTFEEYRHS